MNTDKENKKIVSIEIPLDLYAKLLELSKKDSRTFSSFVRKVLVDYVSTK